MKTLLAIGLVLTLLTGCETMTKLVEVKVMVPVACNETMPTRPVMPTETMPLKSKVDVQARHMRAEIDRREAYEIKLVTALKNCLEPLAPDD